VIEHEGPGIGRRAREVPRMSAGHDGADRAEDDRDYAEALPHGARLNEAEDGETSAGDERQQRGRPVERSDEARPLVIERAVAGERQIEAEDGDHEQEVVRPPRRQHQRGDGHRRHRPEVDLSPAAVGRAALDRQHGTRRDEERDHPRGDVNGAKRDHESVHRESPSQRD